MSDSFTDSALTIPSRSRSWMIRSSARAPAPATALGPGTCAVAALATVPPRDNESKEKVEPSEAKGQNLICPDLRNQHCDRTKGEE